MSITQVKCFCLNRMDIIQRQGNYPPPPGASDILGVEVSGIVEAVGKKGKLSVFDDAGYRLGLMGVYISVTKYKPGDAVFGLMGGGGYAEASD